MAKSSKRELSAVQADELLERLKTRFEGNMQRHKKISWTAVEEKLRAAPEKLWSLKEMERTGGEPDVVGEEDSSGKILFFDCAAESPKDRRSLCYDPEALESRKKFKPKNSAIEMASSMGVDLLTEEQYQKLQSVGEFDLKTSSWLQTPAEIRSRGGAIFGDRRFGRVFIYHNGAESYYAARGFRACLKV